MIKKIIGYILIFIGCLCFLIVSGGSMRNRYKMMPYQIAVKEGILIILFYIITPIVGFFLLKIGFKLITKKDH